MIQVETLITALVGLTLGALVAAPGLMVYSRSLTGELVPAVPAWMAGSLVVGSVLLALAGAVLPTRRALRTSPLAATGARE
jgi:putative ABC transport system permease protein